MPPIFTTVEYLVTHETRVEFGPCSPPPLIRPTILRTCDDFDCYMVQVSHATVTVTPLDNGMCHIHTIFVVEQYHSLLPCKDYEPPDVEPPVEWFGLIEPPPLSWTWPPPSSPVQWIEDGGACENDRRFGFRIACVKGRIQVSRQVNLVIALPLPGGRCRKLGVEGPWETYMTDEPCEGLDWVDAPEGFTGGYDPQKLWARAAEQNARAEEKADEGTFRLGGEWNRCTPLAGAIGQLRKLELDSGVALDQSRSRHVVIQRLNSEPCTPKALATVKAGPAVVVVSIEGSDFKVKAPLYFIGVDHVQG